MTTLLLFGSMLLLALIGVPLVFAILAASVVTLLVVRPEMPLLLVGQVFMTAWTSSCCWPWASSFWRANS